MDGFAWNLRNLRIENDEYEMQNILFLMRPKS